MLLNIFKNPITQKRILRFKEIKRAYLSLIILLFLYLVSLGSELVCNNIPVYVKFDGKSFFPIFKFYPESTFSNNNKKTRPDYKSLNKGEAFQKNSNNYMIFPPIPFGPFEIMDPKSIDIQNSVYVILTPAPRIGVVNIKKDYSIKKATSFKTFINKNNDKTKGIIITDCFNLSKKIKKEIDLRFNNKDAPYAEYEIKGLHGKTIQISLSQYRPRKRSPKTVRLTFREIYKNKSNTFKFHFYKIMDSGQDKIINKNPGKQDWSNILSDDKTKIIKLVKKSFSAPVDTIILSILGKNYTARFQKQEVRFPHPPVSNHFMGIDGAGRDVTARILYGLRTSLSFALLLVIFSMALGMAAGAVQGYYGGLIDITGQRFLEIWSALPFLYIMILMGSVYGRSFILLLFCYGIFNWIGISYYIRAEFLRLRKQPFVEAAQCMGISSPVIIFRHILPNALVPAITFFPFSLVSAIGSLAALDYLGFGLPPPTPSWGELLFQAQQYRWAWWLVLYPSAALFIVMLCGVFIGEGMRNAYDPKQYARFT